MKSLVLDGLANYIFFVPIVIVFGVFITGWNLEDILAYLITAIGIGFVGGAIYGKFLDFWRRKLNYN